jgi:hypothetical protein
MMKILNSQQLIVIKSFFERAIETLEEEYLLHDRPEQIERIIDRLLPYTENDYFPAFSPYTSLIELDRLLVDQESMSISAEEEPVVVRLVRFLIMDYILKQQENFFKLPAAHPSLTRQRIELEERLKQYQQEHVSYLRQTLSTELQDQVPSFRCWMDESERMALLQARAQRQTIPNETTRLLANAPEPAVPHLRGLMPARAKQIYSIGSCFSFIALLGGSMTLINTLADENSVGEKLLFSSVEIVASLTAGAGALLTATYEAQRNRGALCISTISACLQLLFILALSTGLSTGIATQATLSYTALFASVFRLLLLVPLVVDDAVVEFCPRRAVARRENAAADLETANVRQDNLEQFVIQAPPEVPLVIEQREIRVENILPPTANEARYSPLFLPQNNIGQENLDQAESICSDLTPVPGTEINRQAQNQPFLG